MDKKLLLVEDDEKQKVKEIFMMTDSQELKLIL